MNIILAVDDDPNRYVSLSKIFRGSLVLVCVQNPVAAEMVLDTRLVVCAFLDHDMPEWTGQHYAREIFAMRSVPVCISSANPVGAEDISSILTDYGVSHEVIPVSLTHSTQLWADWVQRILDKRNSQTEVLRKLSELGTQKYGGVKPLCSETPEYQTLVWNLPQESMEVRVRKDGKINWYRTTPQSGLWRCSGNEGWSSFRPEDRWGNPWSEK